MARPVWFRRPNLNDIPPPEPHERDPMDEARDRWDELRNYATQVADMLRVANETIQRLNVENDGLRAEVDHVRAYTGEEIKALSRDNRLLRGYAQALRTRMTVIRENIEVAEKESLQYALQEADMPARHRGDDQQTDDDGARAVHDSIVRINADRMPVNQIGRDGE